MMHNRVDIIGAVGLALVMQKERVHVLYTSNQPLTQWWGLLTARLAGVPVIVSTCHQDSRDPAYGRKSQLVNWLTQRWTDSFIVLSPSHKDVISRWGKINVNHITVIPNGVDMTPFMAAVNVMQIRHKLGLPFEGPILGIVAMLRPEKDHEAFLRAAQIIHAARPDCHFLIIGDGPERARLTALAGQLQIAHCTHFLGRRDDVPELMAICDVGILSSRLETFPVAILEFMAAGKPVVATEVGRLSELVVHGKTGWLVPPGNPEALAKTALQVLEEPIMAARMGVAGWRRVEQHFTVDRMVSATEVLLETLLEKKRHLQKALLTEETRRQEWN
jgi:glycosyltransferase involved in cell wall biosynthesis